MIDETTKLKLLLCQYRWALAHMHASIFLDDEPTTIVQALARGADAEWNQSLIDCQNDEIDLRGMPPPDYMEGQQ